MNSMLKEKDGNLVGVMVAASKRRGRVETVAPEVLVITSYSIHYTKLYEDGFSDRMVKQSHPGAQHVLKTQQCGEPDASAPQFGDHVHILYILFSQQPLI